MDDIVRQFKGVSGGVKRKIVNPLLPTCEDFSTTTQNSSVCNVNEKEASPRKDTAETLLSSEYEDENSGNFVHENINREGEQTNGSHSDKEMNLKGFPPSLVEEGGNVDLDRKHDKEAPNDLEEVPPEVY